MNQKYYPTRKVREILRDHLGLRPLGRGDGSGHERWGTDDGRCVRPVFRAKEISLGSLFALGQSLETQGVIERRAFMTLLRSY